jgi:hypothetical protein
LLIVRSPSDMPARKTALRRSAAEVSRCAVDSFC